MTDIIEAVRKVFKRDNTVEFDVENVSKALVSAHHYLHHVILAGNFSGVGHRIDQQSPMHEADDVAKTEITS